MGWALKLLTAPAAEPVSLQELKRHLVIEHTDDDTLLASYLKSARTYAEEYTRRAFIIQDWEYQLDEFPSGDDPICLPKPPLQSVVSITYFDAAGVSQTLTVATDVVVDTRSEPARITPLPGEDWPDTQADRIAAVVIVLRAGYGAAASNVPEDIRAAIQLVVGDLYANREQFALGQGQLIEHPAALRLLDNYRILRLV